MIVDLISIALLGFVAYMSWNQQERIEDLEIVVGSILDKLNEENPLEESDEDA
jgi:hypothetical protein